MHISLLMNTSAVKSLFTYNYKYNIHLKYTRTDVIFKFSGVFCKNSIDGASQALKSTSRQRFQHFSSHLWYTTAEHQGTRIVDSRVFSFLSETVLVNRILPLFS